MGQHKSNKFLQLLSLHVNFVMLWLFTVKFLLDINT